MPSNGDISVIIATYNRASILRRTLEDLVRVDRSGLRVEFVVMDNNSSDDTKEVIESFSQRLPIRYLFEPRAGKCCALNHVLDVGTLGRIVVFTDDDVRPAEDWLQVIVAACERHPDCGVFGGKIYPIFPDMEIPSWANLPGVQVLGFAVHTLADCEVRYDAQVHPCGPNYWVRCEMLDGRRFEESLGPGRPVSMGDESLFLLRLMADCGGGVYCPQSVVGHHVEPELLAPRAMRRRAYGFGRSQPHVRGLCHVPLLAQHPMLWRLRRVAALAWAFLRYPRARFSLSRDARVVKSLEPLSDIGYNIESLRLAASLRKQRDTGDEHTSSCRQVPPRQ